MWVCNINLSKFGINAAVSHTTVKKHTLHYMKENQPHYYVHLNFGGMISELSNFMKEICCVELKIAATFDKDL